MIADTPTLEHSEARARDRAPSSKRPLRIGVWGSYGGGNQGDELVVATLIANIRVRQPDAEIIGFCTNPADATQRHEIPAFPLYRPVKKRDKGEQNERRTGEGPLVRAKAILERRAWLMTPLRGIRNSLRAVIRSLKTSWNVLTFPMKEIPFVVRSFQALRGTDLLIVAGSGPMVDYWGPWVHPYAMFFWSNLARLTGTKLICLSVGAGPLSARSSRYFVRQAMQRTWYRSYRDLSSARLVESLGVTGAHPVYPDMGFAFDADRYARRHALPAVAKGRTVVGLNVMVHADPRYMPKGNSTHYAAYLQKMANCAAWLLRNDYAVVLLYSQTTIDPRAGAALRDLLHRQCDLGDDARLIEPSMNDCASLVNWISWCDAVVAVRFHGIIVPLLLNIPVIGLAYNQKTFDLMASMGQTEYCRDINTFTSNELIELLPSLLRDRLTISGALKERVADCRVRLAEQFDRVFGAVTVP